MAEDRVQRRLAAILAADVVGYSRLMERDEAGTLAVLKARRKAVLEPAGRPAPGPRLQGHRRRRAGRVRERGRRRRNARSSCSRPWRRRTAICRGPADPAPHRRQSRRRDGRGRRSLRRRRQHRRAPRGARRARRHLRVAGRLEPGPRQGRRAVRGYRRADSSRTSRRRSGPTRCAAASRPGRRHARRSSCPTSRRSPCCPSPTCRGDPEQEYFADGIVEEIITALSRMRWLFVIARNSSFTYKGRAVDVKQVGRELGVRYVLEGSVRKAGNRVRITGQLIDAATGAHLWADRFDGGARGHLRAAGPGDGERGGRDRAEARAGRDRPLQAQADREPRRLRLLSARPCGAASLDAGIQRRGAAPVRQGDRARSRVRRSLRHGGELLSLAQVERLDGGSRCGCCRCGAPCAPRGRAREGRPRRALHGVALPWPMSSASPRTAPP